MRSKALHEPLPIALPLASLASLYGIHTVSVLYPARHGDTDMNSVHIVRIPGRFQGGMSETGGERGGGREKKKQFSHTMLIHC
jgi:hypothetical protein